MTAVNGRKFEEIINDRHMIEIKQVGITEQKEKTWGRIYIDYIEDGAQKFAFRNYLYFEKRNFKGSDSFTTDPAYTWFNSKELVEDYMTVLEGEYDNKKLTLNSSHKGQYGTPSKLLASLIKDIDNGLWDDIVNRRGWYNE